MNRRPDRRTFLKTSTLATAGFWVSGAPAAQSTSANEKLNVGIIGVNNRGAANMGGVSSENIVALCDIDENYLGAAAAKHPKATTYVDWRKMLDQKDLDAVTVSTADQVHALASCWAMRRGISVYCEKPLAHSPWEARELTKIAQRMNVATQLGNQRHAHAGMRRTVEAARAGDRVVYFVESPVKSFNGLRAARDARLKAAPLFVFFGKLQGICGRNHTCRNGDGCGEHVFVVTAMVPAKMLSQARKALDGAKQDGQ